MSNANINERKDPFLGQIIFNKYKIIKRLGRGSFGYIYLVEYQNKLYAMKLENTKKGYYILDKEIYLMIHLYGPRIPYAKSFGQCGYYNVLVMELLGKSLEDIKLMLPSKKMTIPCVCKLSYQMLQILEHIHRKSFLHRDVKPDNFIMGIGPNSHLLYMIDFGFAKTYRDPTTLAHHPMQKGAGITGTARFASINTLSGYTQSRRDDLESLGYVIVYIAKGTLPWANIKCDNKDALYNRILETKIQTTPENLCSGLPAQFEEYIKYIRGMSYEQEPNYKYLRNLFLITLQNLGGKMDFSYDWDNRINDININTQNIPNNNINAAGQNLNQSNIVPNIEKVFNDDNTLKINFDNQVKEALQNGIYTQNEINESGIEPFPMDSMDINDNNEQIKRNMPIQSGVQVPNRRLKTGNCECCSIF
jgi:serine/threonine protein kinase